MKSVMVVIALVLSGSVYAAAADTPLDAAITLYQAASYEDALAALNQLPKGADEDRVDRYRALCLLGLNRSDEASQTIERLVRRRPLLKIDEADSPKLLAIYRDAKARVLPGAARTVYAAAKQDFDQGRIAVSASEFRDVVAIISEIGAPNDASLSDLKLLAEGFSHLAEQQLTTPSPPTTPIVERAAPDASVARRTDTWKIYDAGDIEVAPPVVVSQRMPVWVPRDDVAKTPHAGAVEVVIDRNGNVTAATIITPIFPTYDGVLLQAAKSWRYKPATKDGEPVTYRRAVAVVLTAKAAS